MYFSKMLFFRKPLTLNFQQAQALSYLSGPSASGMVEREHVLKRDCNFNRLACIFVPLHGPRERQHLKIAPVLVIYITLSAVLSLV